MLELLQANRQLTGGALAERLGVDERTVRRYAARLAELGVPVEGLRGRHGGFRLLPGFKLPPLMLTDDEATAVVLGLIAGRRLGLPGEATETALAKVQRVLPTTLRERVQALQETLGFTMAAREGAAPAVSAVLALAAAARERRRVRLRYRSWNGVQSERALDTYGLVFHSGRWYVAGHDHRSGEVRTFRVDRVLAVEPSPETYEVPGDLDPVQHVTRSLAAVPYAHEVEVLLETTAEEARRRISPSIGAIVETEGGVLLRARAERLDGMAQMLAGLGWPFVIHRPDGLRTAVRELSADLAVQAVRPARHGVAPSR
jgi:predicted DNA-binding transcriptional regulator YafY